jgi:hypothetical protein
MENRAPGRSERETRAPRRRRASASAGREPRRWAGPAKVYAEGPPPRVASPHVAVHARRRYRGGESADEMASSVIGSAWVSVHRFATKQTSARPQTARVPGRPPRRSWAPRGCASCATRARPHGRSCRRRVTAVAYRKRPWIAPQAAMADAWMSWAPQETKGAVPAQPLALSSAHAQHLCYRVDLECRVLDGRRGEVRPGTGWAVRKDAWATSALRPSRRQEDGPRAYSME